LVVACVALVFLRSGIDEVIVAVVVVVVVDDANELEPVSPKTVLPVGGGATSGDGVVGSAFDIIRFWNSRCLFFKRSKGDA
jgi:hypothetical protein